MQEYLTPLLATIIGVVASGLATAEVYGINKVRDALIPAPWISIRGYVYNAAFDAQTAAIENDVFEAFGSWEIQHYQTATAFAASIAFLSITIVTRRWPFPEYSIGLSSRPGLWRPS